MITQRILKTLISLVIFTVVLKGVNVTRAIEEWDDEDAVKRASTYLQTFREKLPLWEQGKKPRALAGAFIYLATYHPTQDEIADRYKISTQSMRTHMKVIKSIIPNAFRYAIPREEWRKVGAGGLTTIPRSIMDKLNIGRNDYVRWIVHDVKKRQIILALKNQKELLMGK